MSPAKIGSVPSWLTSPADLLTAPTRELAAVALRQVRRENGFLLHLVCWLATSLALITINSLTTGVGAPWSLWPIGILGLLAVGHGYLAVVLGRRRYAEAHRQVAPRYEGASGTNVTSSSGLRAKILSSLSSAREALASTAPELTTELSLGEAQALEILAWLENAERIRSRGGRTPVLRKEAVAQLSRPGLGPARAAFLRLREEVDLHQAALIDLEAEMSRRRSALESFGLALEGASVARGRDDLLAVATGPIRDRMALLESVLGAGAVKSARSTDPRGVSARIREEVDLARQLQQSILPKEAPRVAGLSVSHLYQPSNEVGGDFYDFYALSPDRLLVALGDASGHGLDSSMVSSMAKSALYAHVSSGRELPETMGEMNRMIWDTLGKQRLMTLALLEIDASRRELAWINAGQVFPLLLRDGEVIELEAPSYPLGVRRDTAYEIRQQELAPGDLMLVLTDGYMEAVGAAGEPFGWRRLSERLRELDSDDTERVVADLARTLRSHLGATAPQDDVTLIAIGIDR